MCLTSVDRALVHGRVNQSHWASPCLRFFSHLTAWLLKRSASLCNSLRLMDRWTAAIISFLSEAAAAVARRPDQLWETQLSLSAQRFDPSVPQQNQGRSGQGFSLLVVSALQQALKVAASSKRPSYSRAAVCSYVAGKTSGQQWPECRVMSLITCMHHT